MALKHDPTKGLRMPAADPNDAARRGEYAGVDMGNNPAAFIAEQQVCIVKACNRITRVIPTSPVTVTPFTVTPRLQ